MKAIELELEEINPLDFFGPNNENLKFIKKCFPLIKVSARGNKLKAEGEEDLILEFESKIHAFIDHSIKFGQLTEAMIIGLLTESDKKDSSIKSGNLIVSGKDGQSIKAKTPNQKKMVSASTKDDLVLALGPAGTGKTYTAVALAVRALKKKQVKKIILTRPIVEAGEQLGFLPGDIKEKVDPYLRPLYDALDDMYSAEKIEKMIADRIIEIAPLAFMRGRTLDKAFIILDEGQNATYSQLKMFLTRVGPSSQCIITGDMSQIDLPRKHQSGLLKSLDHLKKVEGVSTIFLDHKDVLRHPLVGRIIKAFDKLEKEQEQSEK